MKMQRAAIGLTLVNLVLLIFLLAQTYRAGARDVAPVLRGRALEIVDDQGRVRAEILVHGPETVNSVTYPEAVLFRMSDPKIGPVVKVTAAEDGAAFGLMDADEGMVQLYANRRKGNFLRIANKDGHEQTIRP
jgi:hypothetical protein